MHKNDVIEFAKNYNPYKTMRNPEQNKIIVCSLLIFLTAYPLYIFKVYLGMLILIIISLLILAVGLFASRIGCIKILNNISLSIFLGLAFPICTTCIFANQIGYLFLNILFFLLMFSIAILLGFIYTRKKINTIYNNNEKPQNQQIRNVLTFLIISFVIGLLRLMAKEYFLFVLIVAAYIAMIFFVPKIIASIIQFIIVKKHKLDV